MEDISDIEKVLPLKYLGTSGNTPSMQMNTCTLGCTSNIQSVLDISEQKLFNP
jgi:hypothetical protein